MAFGIDEERIRYKRLSLFYYNSRNSIIDDFYFMGIRQIKMRMKILYPTTPPVSMDKMHGPEHDLCISIRDEKNKAMWHNYQVDRDTFLKFVVKYYRKELYKAMQVKSDGSK